MTTSAEIIAKHKRYVIPTYAPGLVLVKGKGTRVWDADGKVYLDFLAGIAVQNLGHCHPRVVEAICTQAQKLVHVSNLYYNENQPRLAEKLANLALHGKCFFANSGAEANEALIKLVRLWGSSKGRHDIITMTNSFHGRTLATLAATGQTKYQEGFAPLTSGFSHVQFNDLESVKAAITDKTAAVLVEAVQGEGGVIPATPEFMQGVRALCDEHGILMLCDEVQCGMGRTGRWFGFQHFDVEPDAFSLAKALGSGYPIGAIVTRPHLADVFQPGKHASTFGGSPLACAAALATIQAIDDEKLLDHATAMGDRFKNGISAMAPRYEHIKDVRGLGLMIGIELDQAAKPIVDKLTENGLISVATGAHVVRFLPPLNVKQTEIDEALEIIDEVMAEVHGITREE